MTSHTDLFTDPLMLRAVIPVTEDEAVAVRMCRNLPSAVKERVGAAIGKHIAEKLDRGNVIIESGFDTGSVGQKYMVRVEVVVCLSKML